MLRWRSVLFLGALGAPTPALAQEPQARPEAGEHVVPARLIAPVTPAYPAAALAERATGSVTVVVTIGVDGAVVDAAHAEGGPLVFVEPALAAARSLRFEPATLGGVPVQTRLPATFRFEPPPPPPPPPTAGPGAEADYEVVVVGEGLAQTETHAVVTLGEQELDRSSGQDVGEALSQVSGVTAARGSSDSTKPIIRGQYERRLLLLVDGVRHESQKWGLDHAPEIDPFAAGKISVIKGAAGVRYGPDAIGGVVLVDPPALRTEPGVGGKAQLVGVSNGGRGVAAARLDGVLASAPEFSWRVQGNYGRGAALSTPDYVLGNTASEEWNAGGSVGWQRANVQLVASFRHYDFAAGVCYCVSHHTPADFVAQLDLPAPIGSEDWTTSYAIDRPYQAVTHDLALVRGIVAFDGGGSLKATYAFQQNLRQEYEQVREDVQGPQYDFTLRTHTLDLFLGHGDWTLGLGSDHSGGLGIAGTFQENVYAGLPLIPNYRSFQAGVYAFERVAFERVAVEAGARYDHLVRSAFLAESAYDLALARGTLDPDDCTLEPAAAHCPNGYDGVSVSLGGLWHAVPDALEARLDLSSATRFPNADELYMNGSAPTAPVYALGDPGLGAETTWGASPTLGVVLPWVELEASTYANFIDDYIYFAPERGPDGEPVFDVTIRGTFPRYAFRPIDALFYGVDGGFTLGPQAVVRLVAQGSIVRAQAFATGDRLVMIPSDRVQASGRVVPSGFGPVREPFAEITGEYVFEQTRVDIDADFAAPPDAYFLLSAAVGAQVPLGEGTLKLGVEGSNLLNERYREYTSLLRYFADEPGRDLRARVGFDF